MIRTVFAYIALMGFAPLAGSPVAALTLATSEGSAHCAALSFPPPPTDSFGPTTAEIVQLGCDRLGTRGAPPFVTTVQSVVVLNTGHSAIPVADVQLALTLLAGSGANPVNSVAFGNAAVDYQADIRLMRAAPFTSRIPILLFSRWSIDRTAGTDAMVEVVVDHRPPLGPEGGTRRHISDVNDPSENIGGTFVIGFGAVRGVPIDIHIESECDTARFSLRPGHRQLSCQAVIDPVIQLDQATFDATWGVNSFNLADFYEVGLSANLPEPGQTLLLVLGLLGLAVHGRKRTRTRA